MALVAHLGGQVGMPAGGGHHQLRLVEGTAHRFFEVDVLALVEGQHSDREVGMVRDRRCDRVELIATLVEHLTIVTEPLGLRVHGKHLLALGPVNVDIAKGDHIDHSGPGEITDDLLTTVTYTDKGDLDFLAPGLGRGSGQTTSESVLPENLTGSQSHAGGCDGHGLEKISSVNHMVIELKKSGCPSKDSHLFGERQFNLNRTEKTGRLKGDIVRPHSPEVMTEDDVRTGKGLTVGVHLISGDTVEP